MYCGKMCELEEQGATGTYFTICFLAEVYRGGADPDLDGLFDIDGDTYDNWDDACYGILDEDDYLSEMFEEFMDDHPDVSLIAATVEETELVDGIAESSIQRLYPLMLTRDLDGNKTWSGCRPD